MDDERRPNLSSLPFFVNNFNELLCNSCCCSVSERVLKELKTYIYLIIRFVEYLVFCECVFVCIKE